MNQTQRSTDVDAANAWQAATVLWLIISVGLLVRSGALNERSQPDSVHEKGWRDGGAQVERQQQSQNLERERLVRAASSALNQHP